MTDLGPPLSPNERQMLALIRRNGPIPRAALAAPMGLSAMSVTNMARRLIAQGLLTEGDAIRGKVGQPLTPLALAPGGALFFGLKIGRRETELALVDFTGAIRDSRRMSHPAPPQPDPVLAFARDGVATILADQAPALQARVTGMGIAAPSRFWDWGTGMDTWRGRDLAADLGAVLPWPVMLENDASAACGGELLFGSGPSLPGDFLYVYIAHYAGGGLVLDGRLRIGPTGSGGAVGSMPAPGGGQLLDIASVATLETHAGRGITAEDADWDTLDPGVVADWVRDSGRVLAFAALSAQALCDLGAVVIDGALPPHLRDDLVMATGAAMHALPGAGMDRPVIVPGHLGRRARVLGAAALPLAQQFLPGGG